MLTAALLALSYLFGSIPFGFLITYLVKGIDIRNFGSGNIGATNVWRVASKKLGVCVFILDFLKGFLPLVLAFFSLTNPQRSTFVLIAALAVCGHNWTPFLKFKGGKGVATSLGAISGLSFIFPATWLALSLALFVWLAVFFIFRYVSLASLSAGASFFISALVLPVPEEIKILSLFLFIFILTRHRKNIKNLFAKKESRF